MARRRMFSLDIIDTDLFIEMPQTSRLLYYELCMRADDDGFVGSPKKIQKMVGCSDDDQRVLIAKNFIIPFESGIVVITHWKMHNYIQSDRYKPTIYTEEKKQLVQTNNGMYTKCIQDVYNMDTECIQTGYNMDTQVRLGKVRLGKVRLLESEEAKKIIQAYEENVGAITPAAAEILTDYLKTMECEVIIKAIEIAAIANKRSARYINGILKDWEAKGYKVVGDIKENKPTKQTYDDQRQYESLEFLYANKN